MKNRKNLHDYGLVLILLGVLNLFRFLSSVISMWVDGSVKDALATVDADIAVAVRVILAIFGTIMCVLTFADAFIGFKALKVSANPTAESGYIIAAKIFFVLTVIGFVSAFGGLFDGNGLIVDKILNVVNLAIDVVAYIFFIKAAHAVRQDVISGVIE